MVRLLQGFGKQDPKDDWWAWIRGRGSTPFDWKHTFWDEQRVTHDPQDTSSKDWDNSEPDPDAP